MKKIITLITIIAMMITSMFVFSACGNKNEEPTSKEPAAEATTEETAEEATEEAVTEEVLEEPNVTIEGKYEFAEKSEVSESGIIVEEGSYYSFNKDNTFELYFAPQDMTIKGTYEVEGNIIHATVGTNTVDLELVDENTIKEFVTITTGEEQKEGYNIYKKN